jgi:hypothetical protein
VALPKTFCRYFADRLASQFRIGELLKFPVEYRSPGMSVIRQVNW